MKELQSSSLMRVYQCPSVLPNHLVYYLSNLRPVKLNHLKGERISHIPAHQLPVFTDLFHDVYISFETPTAQLVVIKVAQSSLWRRECADCMALLNRSDQSGN